MDGVAPTPIDGSASTPMEGVELTGPPLVDVGPLALLVTPPPAGSPGSPMDWEPTVPHRIAVQQRMHTFQHIVVQHHLDKDYFRKRIAEARPLKRSLNDSYRGETESENSAPAKSRVKYTHERTHDNKPTSHRKPEPFASQGILCTQPWDYRRGPRPGPTFDEWFQSICPPKPVPLEPLPAPPGAFPTSPVASPLKRSLNELDGGQRENLESAVASAAENTSPHTAQTVEPISPNRVYNRRNVPAIVRNVLSWVKNKACYLARFGRRSPPSTPTRVTHTFVANGNKRRILSIPGAWPESQYSQHASLFATSNPTTPIPANDSAADAMALNNTTPTQSQPNDSITDEVAPSTPLPKSHDSDTIEPEQNAAYSWSPHCLPIKREYKPTGKTMSPRKFQMLCEKFWPHEFVKPKVTETVDQELSFLSDAPLLKPIKNVHFNEQNQFGLYHKPVPRVKYYDPAKKVGEPISPFGRQPFQHMRDPPPPNTPQSDIASPERPSNLPPFPISPLLVVAAQETANCSGGSGSDNIDSKLSQTDHHNENPMPKTTELDDLADQFDVFSVSSEASKARVKKHEEEEEIKRRIEEEEQRRVEEARLQEELEAKKKLRVIKTISAEWKKKIADVMKTKSFTHNITPVLNRKDFGTLLPQDANDGIGWLNDEIVNTYLGHITEKGLAATNYKKLANEVPKYHNFSTHLYTNYTKNGFKSVERWAQRARIGGKRFLETEKVLVPINENSHWTLISISGIKRTIEYFDSLSGRPDRYTKFAWDFVSNVLGTDFNADEWRIVDASSVRQQNVVDCGVFVCMNALAIAMGREPKTAFMAEEFKEARWMVAGTLLHGGLTGEFDVDFDVPSA